MKKVNDTKISNNLSHNMIFNSRKEMRMKQNILFLTLLRY